MGFMRAVDVGPKQQKVVSHSWIQNYDFFEVHIQLCCEPYFHLVAHSKRDLQGVFTKSDTQSQPLCEPFVSPLETLCEPICEPLHNLLHSIQFNLLRSKLRAMYYVFRRTYGNKSDALHQGACA